MNCQCDKQKTVTVQDKSTSNNQYNKQKYPTVPQGQIMHKCIRETRESL